MKRKTNLFYNNGPDAKFLTFSNYTEAMTGNFVSTNTKLYPSKFLCLYLPTLEEGGDETKQEFINDILCGKYENKLAFLRDAIIANNEKNQLNTYTIESQLSSLAYLLQYIKEFDDGAEIVYVGEISEQDFNGTYTDTICVVDTLTYHKGELIKDEEYEGQYVPYYTDAPELKDKLYGWFYVNGTSAVSTFEPANKITPSFDGVDEDGYNTYDLSTPYSSLHLTKVESFEADDTDGNNEKEVKFNILIPLFDIINIDYKSDIVTINDGDFNLKADGIKDENGVYNAPYISNVPLGIWFSTIPTITLYRDKEKKYAQSWSLVIGSQFKPFPYMADIPYEISRDSISGAYSTFAQILINQNNITDRLSELSNTLTDMRNKLTELERKVNNCPGIDNNMDNLKQEFLEYKNEVQNILNNYQAMLDAKELKWVNREG